MGRLTWLLLFMTAAAKQKVPAWGFPVASTDCVQDKFWQSCIWQQAALECAVSVSV